MAEVSQVLCPNPTCHKPNLRRARFCQHCGHDMVLNNEAPSDDRLYYITRIIKQGGQGAVYEGIDQDDQVYAIKEMLDRFTDEKERREAISRFNEEAELLQGLKHPRIPRVYSHFTDEGRHYVTMDFIRGEDLEQVIDREGALPEERVLTWADQICDVLGYLHDNGLIYRDMKPSNVMIERATGSVKLVDFGIAKLFKPTERGTQIGTPGYAPPEQYQGFATPASDVYALAATLHHMMTGRDPTEERPFSFPPARSINTKISQATSNALEKALQFRAEDRFDSVAAFYSALRPQSKAIPTQVRVAPATVVLPAPQAPIGVPAASGPVAAPAPVPAARPAPAAPRPVAAPAASANRPAAAPAPMSSARPAASATFQPAAPAQATRGDWFQSLLRTVRNLILVVVLALIVTGGVYIFLPDVASQYLPPLPPAIARLLPQTAPTTPPTLTPRTFSVENLEALVAPDADQAAIRQAFISAYEQRAREQFGPSAVVNQNTPPTYVGGAPERLGEEGGQVRYRASLQGLVLAP